MPLFTLHCRQCSSVSIAAPLRTLCLSKHECHIWIAKPLVGLPVLQNYFNILSEQEIQKAERFHREKDRNLYLAAHLMLRDILSRYIGIQPKKIRIEDIPGKKPALSSEMPSIEFNLSHSDECVAIAISQNSPVGIDVEKEQVFIEWQSIARHYFSPTERKVLQAATPQEGVALFYAFWTRKEAFLKATGIGLIDELPDIDTSNTANIFSLKDNIFVSDIPKIWQITTFQVEGDYWMSLAVAEHINQISTFQWNFHNMNFH